MTKIHRKLGNISQKGISVLRNEGPAAFAKRSSRFVYYRQFPHRKKKQYKDILFINGCTLPHPERYRVNHQMEQLAAGDLTADSVFYEKLTLDMLQYYRGFVFFRCPVTDTVRQFIDDAKQQNKICFFDIDDLVIDTKYTNKIKHVAKMTTADKAVYDDGVNRMRQTLELCDLAITTTGRLQTELGGYAKEVLINRNVASDEMIDKSADALKVVKRDPKRVVIGYFSGSITHNEDFDLVLPSLVRLLDKHQNLYLKIAGYLDIPAELSSYKNRIIGVPFMDWRLMPKEIASCDINIAPLTNTIFNEAKSENKWTEAALVKVVTVASNLGAFKAVIQDGETGALVKDSGWYSALDDLIVDSTKRTRMGEAAYQDVLDKHTTIGTAKSLADMISAKLARNIAFILPSTDISGGVNVVLKHADILRSNGWDVTLIDTIDKKPLKKAQGQYDYRLSIPGYNVVLKNRTNITAYFDTMVATLWLTTKYLKKYPNVKNRVYFVQNYETDFYSHGTGEPRLLANATYGDQTGIQYTTMSLWCQKWLKDKFGQTAKYTSNGIDLKNYPFKNRDFTKPTINILIEGDSKDTYKNTDEAFRVVAKLDPAKYKISYLSYRKEPKDWYRVDHFYNRIAPDKVGEVYAANDILIKTSLLESFSYPPLEMMATGGIALVVPNDGNVEYLRDGKNCLFYKQGDIDDALAKLDLIMTKSQLREKLINGGQDTAHKYQWKNLVKDVLAIYQ